MVERFIIHYSLFINSLFIMLKYQIYQSKLAGTSAYGKFYARIVTDESIDC